MRGWFGYEQCKRMKAGKNTISIFLLFALVWHNTHGEAVSPTSPTPTAPTPATPTAKAAATKDKRMTNEYRLLRDLFENYDKEVRPVFNKTDVVNVNFSMSLIQIVNVNSKSQMLTISVWIRQKFKNPMLAWNASKYGGIKSVNVDATRVWVPDIILYNNADDGYAGGIEKYKTQVILQDDGSNAWFSPAQFTSTCKINVQYFPFDRQSCPLKFGSWTYGGNRLMMTSTSEQADTSMYVLNGEWHLVSMPAKLNKVFYNCCNYPFYDVTLTLDIKRKPLYYVFNLIMPCALIATLTLIKFFLPPESGEKVGLGITVLLAMTVFLLLVADSLPSTSEHIPLLGQYFVVTMFDTALSLVATCLILNFFHRNPSTSPMPRWVKVVVLGYMARVFCFKDINQELEMQAAHQSQKRKSVESLAGTDLERHTLLNEAVDFPRRPQREENACSAPTSDVNTPIMGRKRSRHAMDQPEFTEKLLEGINVLAEDVRARQEDERLREEWRMAALVLDRVFFWFFLFTTVLCSFLIFYRDAVTEDVRE